MSDGQAALGEEALDTQEFFESRRAAAVLKHEILKGYIPPFVGKTGRWSPGNRVVILDGFAGAGRYGDGEAGSPAIFAEAARKTPSRNLECYFVEKDPGNYASLVQVLQEEGDAITWEAWEGTAGERMDEVLSRATGLPLFMFIDPYGIGPDFAQVQDVFKRRPGGRGTAATEMLYRVDASVLRRILGAFRAGNEYAAREKHLERVDELAGGSWWRDEDDGVRTGEAFLEWFFDQYLERLCNAIGCSGWYTDVKQKPHHQPAYYLVFLTRHPDGIEIFGDTLSRALAHWRATVFFEAVEKQQERTGQFMLDPASQLAADEALLEASWHDAIEQNVRALLRQHDQFRVRDHLPEVFGAATIGQAREKHVRKALERLHKAGITSTDKKGEIYTKVVRRAPDAQP